MIPCTTCNTSLSATGCRPCAILICSACRQNPERFRLARSRMFSHIDEHIEIGRRTNPWYPFESFEEAFVHE